MKQPAPEGIRNSRRGEGQYMLRGSAVSAAAGGAGVAAYAITMAMQPRGCIAEECIGRSYREAGPAQSILFLGGLVLIAAAVVGLSRMHAAGSTESTVVRQGALAAAIALVTGALLVNTPFFFVAVAAFILALLAFAVTGLGLMMARVLPAWSGAVLLITSLLLFGANDQNERVLLLVPFSIAWLLLGGLLWSAAASSAKRLHGPNQHE